MIENDAISLEYKLNEGRAGRQVNLLDFVNNTFVESENSDTVLTRVSVSWAVSSPSSGWWLATPPPAPRLPGARLFLIAGTLLEDYPM
jgi:hypothetical protein